MARRRTRSDGPVPLSESLSQVAARFSKRDLVGLAAVHQAWEERVDASIREYARPLKLAGSTVVIAVDQPSRATQIRLMSGGILTQLNAAEGVDLDGVEVVVRKA